MSNSLFACQDEGAGQRTLVCARAAVYALLGLFCCFFAYGAAKRLAYPFHNEWLEGEILCHVVRLLEGHAIYEPPSSAFVAEVYPPLYYFAAALAAKLVGVNFLAGRIVSVLALGGIIVMIYLSAAQATGRRSIGLVCSAFFISFYQVHGGWYDVARVDMLFFLLLTAACFLLERFQLAWWAVLSSAATVVLACFTKQPALAFVPFMALFLAAQDPKKALAFAVVAGLLFAMLFWALHAWTDGWFTAYAYLNPLRYAGLVGEKAAAVHYNFLAQTASRLPAEMRYEICYKLPIFCALLLAFLLHRLFSLRRPFAISIWEGTAIPAVVCYGMIRPHLGSEKNDLIYITLWGCLLLGILLGRLSAWSTGAGRRLALATLYCLLALQLVLQLYRPGALVPAAGSAERGRQFIGMVRDLPGDVFIPAHPFYAVMAGKPMTLSAGAFWGYQVTAAAAWRPEELIDKIRHKQFSAIIVEGESYYWLLGERRTFNSMQELLAAGEPLALAITDHYKEGGRVMYDDAAEMLNTTGVMTRPELMLVPRT